MRTYSIIAARDGDVYHDSVEAETQEEAEAEARAQLASAWGMTPELQDALNESDPTMFDAELDGFAVDPAPTMFTKAELLVVQDAVSNSDLQPSHERIKLLDKIGTMLNEA